MNNSSVLTFIQASHTECHSASYRSSEQKGITMVTTNSTNFTVCFTGHRPNKLAGGYDYYSESNIVLARQIKHTVLALIEKGANHFICGGIIN